MNENVSILCKRRRLPLAAILIAAASPAFAQAFPPAAPPPYTLTSSGGFIIGGQHKFIPATSTTRTLSCDHGYVEYFYPQNPKKTSIVLWHSSSTQVWQNRWDGGPGYKDMLLRRGNPTYLWDGPRVGRANWSCDAYTYTPQAFDQGNFTSWNFGPTNPVGLVPTATEWFANEQFPKTSDPNYADYWWNATGARYAEFDIEANIEIETDAAAVAADSGRLGNQIVYLTNSAGGLRAMKTTAKTHNGNIKGIVTYESIGYVFPIGDPDLPGLGITICTATTSACAFGPLGVSQDDFKKIASLQIQFVWGDHRNYSGNFGYSYVQQSIKCAQLLNKYSQQFNLGGHAEVLLLGDTETGSPNAGLPGSSHIAFADMDNDKVFALLDKFLKQVKLDK